MDWRQGIRNFFSEDLGRKENRKWSCIVLVLLKTECYYTHNKI